MDLQQNNVVSNEFQQVFYEIAVIHILITQWFVLLSCCVRFLKHEILVAVVKHSCGTETDTLIFFIKTVVLHIVQQGFFS